MRVRVVTVLAAVIALWSVPAVSPAGEIAWQGWSDAAFAKARAEKRLVVLDLGAVWCHWCHVMEETTYRDPKVVSLLEKHFVAVRVDQDARPDLSNRLRGLRLAGDDHFRRVGHRARQVCRVHSRRSG